MNHAMAFDVGSRRIGVAVGNPITRSAQPVEVVAVRERQPDWQRLDALLQTWQPGTLVVGLPLTREGGEQAMTRRARHFAEQLGRRSRLPVELVDERHSSQEAARRFADERATGRRRRRDAALLDAMAAAVILQSWFEHH